MTAQQTRIKSVEPKVSEVHAELFHYTSIAALGGILSTDTLWATCATHLNDSSEMQLLWPPMRDICTRFVEEEIRTLHPEHSAEAKNYAALDGPMIASLIRDKLLGGNGHAGWGVPYVSSFTTHEDDYHSNHGMLSQWRGYGGTDGVAIVFDTKEMEELLTRECERFEYFGCSVSEVVYHQDENNLVEQFSDLFEAVNIYVRHVMEGRNVHDTAVLDNLSTMSKELLPVVGRVKHHAFQEESEYRIIVGVPHEACYRAILEDGSQTAKPFKKLHFRPGVCGSVPYIRLFEKEGKGENSHKCIMPISRIIVGPSRNQSANIDSVRALLSDFVGHGKIHVQRSEIPYVATA